MTVAYLVLGTSSLRLQGSRASEDDVTSPPTTRLSSCMRYIILRSPSRHRLFSYLNMSVVKPELACLARELKGLTLEELVEMAVQLGMDLKEVRKIEPENRRLNTMSVWLDSDSEASWQKVAKALRYINKIVLAQKLEEKYCGTDGSEKGSETTCMSSSSQPIIDWYSHYFYPPVHRSCSQ